MDPRIRNVYYVISMISCHHHLWFSLYLYSALESLWMMALVVPITAAVVTLEWTAEESTHSFIDSHVLAACQCVHIIIFWNHLHLIYSSTDLGPSEKEITTAMLTIVSALTPTVAMVILPFIGPEISAWFLSDVSKRTGTRTSLAS